MECTSILTRVENKYLIILFFLMNGFFSDTYAASRYWTGAISSSWNNSNNWDDGGGSPGLPVSGDNVIFDATSSANCNIDVNTASLTGFSIAAAYAGTITVNANFTIDINSGTANFSIAGGTFDASASTGQITITGTFSQTGGTFVTNASGGVLNVRGSFSKSGGTFTATSGSITRFSSNSLTINDSPVFHHVEFVNSVGGAGLTFTIASSITVNGNISFNSGLSNSTRPMTLNTGTINLKGDITSLGNYTGTSGGGTATIILNGTGAQGITGPSTDDGRAPLCNLEFNSTTARTITITNAITVAGLAISGSGGDITINTGTINDLGALTVTNTGTGGGGTATINMNGTAAQTITGSGTAGQGRLPNVIINRASASNNNLTLASVISVEGNWTYTTAGTGTSVVSPGASTVAFYSCTVDGQGASNTMPFFNVGVNSGTITLAGALDVNGALTIAGSSILSAAAFAVNVAGDFSNSGTYTHGNNTLTFDGNAVQNISGSSTSTFYNLTVTGSSDLRMGANGNLENVLTLSGGSSVFDADGTGGTSVFTLLSTSSRTARVAALTTPANFTGNITMQRFIPVANKGWKYFGSPVSGTTIGDADDGGDLSTAYYYFNEAANLSYTNGYVAATGSTSMGVGQGFLGYAAATSNITLDVTGPANKGDINLPVTFTTGDGEGTGEDGWNLVSNPYPAEINWDLLSDVTLKNIDATFYVWNANLLSGLGDYAYYTQGSFVYDNYRPTELNCDIAAGQAFYVRATASPTLSLTESCKSSNNPVFLKTGKQQVGDNIRLALGGQGLTTYTNVKFMEGATTNFDSRYDAYKLFSFSPLAPSICSLQDNIYYATNVLPELSSEVTVPLRTYVGTAGTYTLSAVDLNGVLPGSCITLYDTYLDTSVNLRMNPYIAYMPDTMDVPRFMLHISPPAFSFTSSKTDITCHKADDGRMIVNPGVGTWNYVWKNGTGSVIKSKMASAAVADTLDNLKPAYYSVEVSESGGCGSYIRENFEVLQPGATIAGFNVSSGAIDLAFNAAVNFTNTSVMADSYEWDFGDGSSISTLENPLHTYNAVGEYKVMLVANNSDCSLSDTAVYSKINVVNSSTNIDNAASGESVFIGNNGNSAFVALNFGQPAEVVISIYNIVGQKIMEDIYRHTSHEKIELNISGNSVYLVSVKVNDRVVTKKIFR